MSGFLYFIPDHITRVEQLREWGLGYLFEAGGRGFYPCQGRGVGGVQGTVIGDERLMDAPRITCRETEQTWRKVPKQSHGATKPRSHEGDVHVGMWNDARPGPEDLVRTDALAGHNVRLCDGNEWIIPVARGASETDGELRYAARLPRRIDLDDEGRWVSGKIVDRYRELWDVACAFWDAFTGAGIVRQEGGVAVHMDFEEMMQGAVTAIAVNYRIGALETAMLGLFDEVNLGEILRAVIDWPVIERFVQKKSSEPAPAN
jgi:hypothetical protein